jgi:hypothetical protein
MLVVAASSLLGLAACTSLPTSGSYQPGLGTDTVVQNARWLFNPNGPADGASPAEIVLGFLDAGESPVGDWQIAREFLTPEAAAAWDPGARVTIDDVDERDVSDLVANDERDTDGEVSMRVTSVGALDETGLYTAEQRTARSLDFEVVKVDGQWRISSAPDGIVVQSGNFTNVFLPQTLVFSGLENHLVPDVRWFPDVVLPVRRSLEELIDGGPAPWLEGAVTSAFSGVDFEGVQIDDGVVTVALSTEAADASSARRARMQTQLERTLDISTVRMTVDGSRLTGPADTIAEEEPDARAIVMTEDDFGYLAGGEIEEIPGLSDAIRERFTPSSEQSSPDPATSISVAPDLGGAAVQTESGVLWWIDAESASFEPLTFESGWIAPSLDPFGYVWSAKDDDPDRLWAWGADPDPVGVETELSLTDITSMAVSRDGARIAVIGHRDDQPVLVIAAISRDDTGAPTGVDGVESVSHLEADGTDVAWVSSTIVSASMSGDGRTLVREQQVGGTSERLTASFTSTSLAYGNTKQRERLLSEDGALYIRYQRTWQQAGSEVVVLATQVGAPETAVEPQP